jgi:hypothetical protein
MFALERLIEDPLKTSNELNAKWLKYYNSRKKECAKMSTTTMNMSEAIAILNRHLEEQKIEKGMLSMRVALLADQAMDCLIYLNISDEEEANKLNEAYQFILENWGKNMKKIICSPTPYNPAIYKQSPVDRTSLHFVQLLSESPPLELPSSGSNYSPLPIDKTSSYFSQSPYVLSLPELPSSRSDYRSPPIEIGAMSSVSSDDEQSGMHLSRRYSIDKKPTAPIPIPKMKRI